jgi:penicillin G amidase
VLAGVTRCDHETLSEVEVGFFERPDLRLSQSADPTPSAAIARTLKSNAIALAISIIAVSIGYAVNVAIGLREAAVTRGTLVAPGLYEPVTIVRDRSDVPHIVARNEHDLYFAEGYAQGSDRLFQLDLTRRYAYGRLAEILGPKALALDEEQRAVDIDGIAERQLRALAARDREAIAAFSDGVNAAADEQPLPVEFRMLLYRPAPWIPKDSLAVSIVASLALADSWHDVFARDATWRRHDLRCYDELFPLSDFRYDVTVDGARNAPRHARRHARDCAALGIVARAAHTAIGSNAWGAGALRTIDGNALVANDPHLDLTIPGIWYLVDIRGPHVHAAGATIPGIPGVVLGHNDNVAWASTNAQMTTSSVFEAGRLGGGARVFERFKVRFSHEVRVAYYRTQREFSVPNDDDRSAVALVRWPVYAQTSSTIATALGLDRARNVHDALQILAGYRGSPQNFILADRSGSVAYHVAGLVPDDPAWGRYVHPARDLRLAFSPIPFWRLPAQAPTRDAILISANNKAYGPGYPYRLSAQFEPPYRAYRIAELLRLRPRYDVGYFARMQLDTLSPIDLEIAHDAVRLAWSGHAQWNLQSLRLLERWDGRYEPNSQAASLEHSLRFALFDGSPALSAGLSALRDDSRASAPGLDQELDGALSFASHERRAWSDVGGTRIQHPLAPMNFAFLNGAWLPGAGDEYTIHLQEPGFAQGFRAVWDVGDWDRGGISIPSGESGEPASGHYTDLTHDWVDGLLTPLPFSLAAVRRAAAEVLVLRPR